MITIGEVVNQIQMPWWGLLILLAFYIEIGVILGVHWSWLLGYSHGSRHKESVGAEFICPECSWSDADAFGKCGAILVIGASFALWPIGIFFRWLYAIWGAGELILGWIVQHVPSPMDYFRMIYRCFEHGEATAKGDCIEGQGTRTDAT